MSRSPEFNEDVVKKTAKARSGIDLKTESLNQIKKGEGKLFHRRYDIIIKNPQVTAENLMAQIQSDISSFCPKFLAHFEKLKGNERKLKKGDQYDVHITGPWPAKVEVLEVGPLHFTLVTKDEHLEAGQIDFTIEDHNGQYLFAIESWARSRDWLVNFFYDVIPLIRIGQVTMWKAFCKKVEKAASLMSERKPADNSSKQRPYKQTFNSPEAESDVKVASESISPTETLKP